MSIGFISYLVAFIGYSVLTLLLVISSKGKPIGKQAILASATTAVWAAVSVSTQLNFLNIPIVISTAEILKSSAWCYFLLSAVNHGARKQQTGNTLSIQSRLFIVILTIGLAVIYIAPFLGQKWSHLISREFSLIFWITLAIFGLLLVEHLYRHSNASQRWAIKYLCLGVGSMFAYDFFMFSDALLFKHLNTNVWQARGIVYALMVPLIAISIARKPDWSIKIHVSRQVVFHSATLLGAGGYLLAMATAGYYIKFYGGTWGSTLQIAFFAGSGALLLILLFSGNLRARVRVLLSKHFFSYRYDYREEWLKFTQTLSEGEQEIPVRTIMALSAIVDSSGGDLWLRQESGDYRSTAQWFMPAPPVDRMHLETPLIRYLKTKQWIIDLNEYSDTPDLYDDLDMPDWLISMTGAWLIVPLLFKSDLLGFLVIKVSPTKKTINWEDRDLLKMAGRQAASHIAQHVADQALSQARQFEAFNRLSAYVVHDLKNILAQQSLIVSNAAKHKDNPLFVDDVIRTVENSVGRMTRLMSQMKSGMRTPEEAAHLDLTELIAEVIENRSSQLPVPRLKSPSSAIVVRSNREQLANVLGHIIQNAQDATPKEGTIDVRLFKEADTACIEVEDTGCGMTEDFIRDRLFRPFDSTKGLTGMGVGAFESREFIRGLGGDIQVKSELGKGSLFKIKLPIIEQESD